MVNSVLCLEQNLLPALCSCGAAAASGACPRFILKRGPSADKGAAGGAGAAETTGAAGAAEVGRAMDNAGAAGLGGVDCAGIDCWGIGCAGAGAI